MPIEIKELHIRVNVNTEDCDSGRQKEQSAIEQSSGGESIDKVVDLCVERVLEVIKRDKKR